MIRNRRRAADTFGPEKINKEEEERHGVTSSVVKCDF
jgi:hypothetical protein